MRDIKSIRDMLGISRAEFSRQYHIPIRTLEAWEWGKRIPPDYVLELLERVVRYDKIKDELGEKIAKLYEEGDNEV